MQVIERRIGALPPAPTRTRRQLAASIGAAIMFIAVGLGSLIAHATSDPNPANPSKAAVTSAP